MSKNTQFLENFKKGDYMCWHVCSQCANLGTVVLRDDEKVYFTAEKKSSSTSLQHLSQGMAQYTGGRNLRVETTVQTSCDLQCSPGSDAILDSSGRNVGFIYNYCIEDSKDDDYNDFYTSLVAWRKKG